MDTGKEAVATTIKRQKPKSMLARAGTTFGGALASSFLLMFVVTLFIFPFSYVMNRFIYHHWAMRLTLGFIAGIMNVGAIIAIFVLTKKESAHYFGLFPLSLTAESTFTVTGWTSFLFKFFGWLAEPFRMTWDEAGYTEAVSAILTPEGSDAANVNEKVFATARELAAIKPSSATGGPGAWAAYADRYKSVAAAINSAKVEYEERRMGLSSEYQSP